jgi:hypothetical protein
MFGCIQLSEQKLVQGAKLLNVKTVPLPKARNQKPTQDPHHATAVERGKAAVRKLQEQGIIDSQGRRIRTDLPADMREGKDRDFGG